MKEIVKAIQDRINRKVSTAMYIDVDWGQLQEQDPPIKWPAVLIDIDGSDYKQLQGDGNLGIQQCIVEIRITLASEKLSPTNARAEKTSRESGLAYYDTLESIHKALQGWSDGEHFGQLERVRMRTRSSVRGHIVKDLYYQTVFIDSTED